MASARSFRMTAPAAAPAAAADAKRASAGGPVRAKSRANPGNDASAPAKPAADTARKTNATVKSDTTPPPPQTAEAVDAIDTSYLESLIGYNARRAALAVIGVFLERMEPYGLKPVEFSALSLITHNPGITSRQLCNALGVLPPNLVGMINSFEKRALVLRRPHPNDGRALGLHLTPAGQTLMHQAEATAQSLEGEAAHRLSDNEKKQLMVLLQKIYL